MLYVLRLLNPENNVYYNLLDFGFQVCNEFYLVVRKDIRIKEGVNQVLERLAPYLKEKKEQQAEWAGTILGRGGASVYIYYTQKDAKEILRDEANSFYEWVQPNLPEDLGFLKNNKPWLINTSHEYMCDIITDEKTEMNRVMQIEELEVEVTILDEEKTSESQ